MYLLCNSGSASHPCQGLSRRRRFNRSDGSPAEIILAPVNELRVNRTYGPYDSLFIWDLWDSTWIQPLC